MEILEQVKEHKVTDYDILLKNGDRVSFTVDHSAGDTVDDTGKEIYFFFPPKQDPVSKAWTSLENRTLYKDSIAMLTTVERTQKQPSESELLDLKAVYHKLSKTLQ